MAAHKTRPPKKQKTRSLAQLRADWKQSAIDTSKVAVGIINSLLERARAAAAAIQARVATVVDVGLAAVDVTAMVFVMNGGGRFHRRHLLAEARRHPALVLRGRSREPGLDDRIVDAAIDAHCVDISEPKTTRGLLSHYRFYTARWALPDIQPARRPPTPAHDPDQPPSADPGAPAAPRPSGQDVGEWEIHRVPLRYDRAVLASAVVRGKLRTTTARRGRAYDVAAHQQAAMPEQVLAHLAAAPERGDQEPEAERRATVDLSALRALKKSRTDMEALGFTDEQLRRLLEVSTRATSRARGRPGAPTVRTPARRSCCARTTATRRTIPGSRARTVGLKPAAEAARRRAPGIRVPPCPGVPRGRALLRFPLTGLATGHRQTADKGYFCTLLPSDQRPGRGS
ncbi:hypothetical protein [Streptomyces scopuliridis]|uniref:hypothetical protein n=1 Tax=Streptomyces scopuliridis TaxID=452529 RepID=UPI00369DB164